MTSIGWSPVYASVLSDLGTSQRALHEAVRQSSSGRTAEDIRGYGRDTEFVVSSKRLLARIDSRRATAQTLTLRFQIQDVALDSAARAARTVRDTVLQAIALGDASGLEQALQTGFEDIATALNTRFDGRYVFAGTQDDSPAVGHGSLTDYLADPDGLFASDARQQVHSLGGHQRVAAGPLASDAQSVFAALKAIHDLHTGSEGPLSGRLTEAQKSALSDRIPALKAAHQNLVRIQADNGRALRNVEETAITLGKQHDALTLAVGKTTDVDLAELALRLSAAQNSFQASASVFNTLRNLSLLDVL